MIKSKEILERYHDSLSVIIEPTKQIIHIRSVVNKIVMCFIYKTLLKDFNRFEMSNSCYQTIKKNFWDSVFYTRKQIFCLFLEKRRSHVGALNPI